MPTISADGTVYTFTLRSGVKFVKGDGTVLRRVVAKDVVASLNRMLNPNLKPTPSPLERRLLHDHQGSHGRRRRQGHRGQPASRRSIDRTVEITLERPSGVFLNLMAMTFAAIVPTELAGTDTEAFSKNPVGTGPFRLAEVKAGESYRFVANEAYWNQDAIRVDEILVPGQRRREHAAPGGPGRQAGHHGQRRSRRGSWDATRLDPRWKDLIRATPLVATNFLWLNTGMADTPLGNAKVRQAISYAIDKANIQKVIGEGRSVAATQIFPPLMPGHDPTFDPYSYDPDKAKAAPRGGRLRKRVHVHPLHGFAGH